MYLDLWPSAYTTQKIEYQNTLWSRFQYTYLLFFRFCVTARVYNLINLFDPHPVIRIYIGRPAIRAVAILCPMLENARNYGRHNERIVYIYEHIYDTVYLLIDFVTDIRFRQAHPNYAIDARTRLHVRVFHFAAPLLSYAQTHPI